MQALSKKPNKEAKNDSKRDTASERQCDSFFLSVSDRFHAINYDLRKENSRSLIDSEMWFYLNSQQNRSI